MAVWRRSDTDSQRGAALLVAVLVLLLVGLTVIAGMRYEGSKVGLARQQAVAKQTTEVIQRALWQFVARNYRLPCPADPTAGNGNEAPVGGGTCTFPNGSTYGVVPWHTLELQQSDALDPWGNQIGYAVSGQGSGLVLLTNPSAPANPGPFQVQIPTPGTDSICVGPCSSFSNLNAYVLISFGPDGAGAYTAAGKKTPAPVGTTEYPNSQVAAFQVNSPQPFVSGPYNNGTPNRANLFDDWLVYQTSEQVCESVNFNEQPVASWKSACTPLTAGPALAGDNTADLLNTLAGGPIQGYQGDYITAGSAANWLAIAQTNNGGTAGTVCGSGACSNRNGSLALLGNVGTVSLTDANGASLAISAGNTQITNGLNGDWIGANSMNSCSQCPYAGLNPGYLVPGQTLTYTFTNSYTSFAFVDYLVNGGMAVQVTGLAGPSATDPSTVTVGTLTITNGPYADNTHATITSSPACLGPAGQSVSQPPVPWLQSLWLATYSTTITAIPNNPNPYTQNTYPPPLYAQQWPAVTFGATLSNYNGEFDYQFANRKFLDAYGNPLPFNILQFQLLPYYDATGAADDTPPYKYGMLFEGLKACPTFPANTVTIGGTVTAQDVIKITFTNSGLFQSPVTESYTVQAGDTPTTIAGALASLINADITLRAASISADNVVATTSAGSTTDNFGPQINIVSEGNVSVGSKTALSTSVTAGSGPGTETIAFNPSNATLGTSPGAFVCDMRGNGPAPTYTTPSTPPYSTYPPGDEWWNPPVNATMDCSLQDNLNLK